MKKKLLAIPLFFLIILVVSLIYLRAVYYPQLPVANGYAAKKMCSCIFIAKRDQKSIQEEDLAFGPLSLTKTKIDLENKSVTTSILGLQARTAVYRNDVGCVLLNGKDDYNTNLKVRRPKLDANVAWPLGSKYESIQVQGIDYDSLRSAINKAFDPSRNMDSLMTRAVVVIYKDTLVMESYANGFDKNTEILGWSMTKSITATLISMMIDEGKFDLDTDHLFPEWDDERKDITLRNLLNMQSGLDFSEEYATLSDATRMLYISDNVSEIPLSNSLKYEPGSHWYYSSGTSNILSALLRKHSISLETYLNMPYERLFNPLGMTSAVLESDESGHFIGSSYMYATPRDWARFGLLYLNQGNWYGEQLIDSSWVDFVDDPVADSKGIYGGHFWLNHNNSAYPDVPSDLYSCSGFQGQYVFIIPSYDAVIVRMGLTEGEKFDINSFLSGILSALDPK
ncbi:MAG: CubicO group peptidase (beta-lactamase class C family) [Saprospiraceae bacterium]|jgi:CubicO group peptidase (beta-lactamase class C family)